MVLLLVLPLSPMDDSWLYLLVLFVSPAGTIVMPTAITALANQTAFALNLTRDALPFASEEVSQMRKVFLRNYMALDL